jgi:hypothetical protein
VVLRAAAVLVLAMGAAACSRSGSGSDVAAGPLSTSASVVAAPLGPAHGSPAPLGPCVAVPAGAGAAPSWVPADLRLPDGAYPVRELAPEGQAQVAVFVVPTTPDDFSTFTLQRWPGDGWRLGRPESEGFEGENRFTRPPAYGGFKVRQVYCDKAKSELTLAYSPG